MNRRDLLKLASGLSILGVVCTYSRSAFSATRRYLLDVKMVDGRPAYNGVSPGLTMRASPGDVIDVDFVNSLPALHDDCTDKPNEGHGINTTNLHTHGLHVSPTSDSSGEFDADNVFVSVVPLGQDVPCQSVCGSEVKTTFRVHKTQYRFELADNHTSGTYWYHAHKHGSTATQVGAGLSGPLIVDDKPGVMPAYIENANEKILMLMNKGLVLAAEEGGGEFDPTIVMQPGEVQRWRIINALGNSMVFSYLRTNLPELEMYLIAYDGFTLEKRVPFDLENLDEPWLNACALASGNRIDLIVRAPIDGDGLSSSKGMLTGLTDLIQFGSVSQPFDLNVQIAGEPVAAEWSDDDRLPGSALEPFDDSPLEKREISFTQRVGIDGGVYDGQIMQTMKKGTAEEWTITNSTGGVHVFHIHVNPLFITHINGELLPEDSPLRRWQDTIGMPAGSGNNPTSVTYKTRFEKFTGKFVIHCHVLRHEDQGMMQIVQVVD